MASTIETSSECDHASEMILRDGVKFLPTPAEIKATCEEIQAEWSADEELRRRAVGSDQSDGWMPHRCNVGT